jgi:CBS domain-containing protein/anti-sigma regulatory factor (Ser/Thr protein kinase)
MDNTTALKSIRTDRRDISIVSELLYQFKVRDVMSRTVFTVGPNHTLRDVQKIMRDKKISGVPVVDGEKLIGIVSLDDIIRALDFGEIEKPVWEKMTRNVLTISDHVSTVKALDEMDKVGFGRLPVLDKAHRLVGIVTHWDVVRKLIDMLQEVAMQAEERERSMHAGEAHTVETQEVTTLEFLVEKDDFENAGSASSKIKKRLQKRDVQPAIIRRIAVAMYEAEINIIIHSLGGKFTVCIYPEYIRITAADRGPGIADIDQAMREGYSTATNKVREMGFGAGMGLPNIKRCSDRFSITSTSGGSTEITFEINFDV